MEADATGALLDLRMEALRPQQSNVNQSEAPKLIPCGL